MLEPMSIRPLIVIGLIMSLSTLLLSCSTDDAQGSSVTTTQHCKACLRLHYKVAGLKGGANGGLKVVVDGRVIHTDKQQADHYEARWVELPAADFSSGELQIWLESIGGEAGFDNFYLRSMRITLPDGSVITDARHGLADNLYVGGGSATGITTKWPLYLPRREFRFTLPPFVQGGDQEAVEVSFLGHAEIDALPPEGVDFVDQQVTDEGLPINSVSADNRFLAQRFRLAAPPAGSHVFLRWRGAGEEGTALWFWNMHRGEWQLLANTEEEAVLEGVVSLSQASRDGHIELMISNAIHNPSASDLVLAWITDTQYQTTEKMRDLDVTGKQARWLAANAQHLGVNYLVTTGDGTESTALQEEEFRYLSRSWQAFDRAHLPWGLLPGNHDYLTGRDRGEETAGLGDICDPRLALYCRYFGAERFRDRPWYGESFRDNENHYDVITHAGEKLLILYLGWSYDSTELAWAADVLARHPGVPVILATHETIGTVATFGPQGMQVSPRSRRLFTKFVERFPQIIMTLGGHFHGAAYRVTREHDMPRLDLVHDYQFAPQTGGGWMHFLYLDLEHQMLSSRPYSPLVDAHIHPGFVLKYPKVELPFNAEYTRFTLPLGMRPVDRWLRTDEITASAITLNE